jgi:hypothetical protein
MDDELQRRIADNEAAFRDVNEAIASGQWPGEADAKVGFRCECARLGCNLLIELTPREYEGVRAHPDRFVLAVGHDMPEAETIVETQTGYIVVEKKDASRRAADSSDPRS